MSAHRITARPGYVAPSEGVRYECAALCGWTLFVPEDSSQQDNADVFDRAALHRCVVERDELVPIIAKEGARRGYRGVVHQAKSKRPFLPLCGVRSVFGFELLVGRPERDCESCKRRTD